MADSVIILYLQFLVRLISYFEKSGQRDLNYGKMCKKTTYYNLLINHRADFYKIMLDTPLRRAI